jgi:putative nucleotidyltransferase with HDIG domain
MKLSLPGVLSFLRDKHAEIYKIGLVLLCISSIVYLFPREGKFKYEFQKGKPWLSEDLIAPFDFAISKKPEELLSEQALIQKNAKLYFRVENSVFSKEEAELDARFDSLWDGKNPQNKEKAREEAHTVLAAVYKKGIIQVGEQIENKPSDYSVFLLDNNLADEVELGSLFTIQSAYSYVTASLNNLPSAEKEFLQPLLQNLLKQNIFYDAETTDKFKNEALNNISMARDMKQKGERIISRGDLIDDNKFNILQSLKNEYINQLGNKTNYFIILTGQFILVTMCVLMLMVFLLLFRKDIVVDNQRIFFVLCILFLVALMSSLSIKFKIESIYILPFCIFAVLVRSFFDTRIALFTHLTSTLIISLIVANPFEFIFIQLLGGIFVIFSIINMRNRSQLFLSVTVLFAAYSLAYAGISAIQEGSIENIDWQNIAWFAISAALTLFAYPLIYVFEKLFGFISDVSLMELADINSPLLRELALKAPGTFQHSLQVANLAEEAIVKIGGTPLLVRTGALYHDIGKMEMPMYFIENQFTGVNPHDELSFEESAAIITGHVAKGVEIAKKNNVPDVIIDFIRTHHGTTKTQFFYQSFLKNFPGEKIEDEDFQYPGPIPFSKETAVLMMADTVEAASRSLKKYDAEAIDNLVERIIDAQIKENQFINSDITFKNISNIKKIFKKKLLNIYHLRIEYPK